MPELFGARYQRAELLRRIGRLEQVAGVRLVTIGDGQGRGVRVLEFRTGTGFAFDVLVDCHIAYAGRVYNGKPAQQVMTTKGATALDVTAYEHGLVGRGVLLDVPRFRGVPWLEPGEA